jgi:hypothetical protein
VNLGINNYILDVKNKFDMKIDLKKISLSLIGGGGWPL